MVNHTNDMCCPICGISYNEFRTGFLYVDIYQMFWEPEHDPSKWKYKRRNTILGRWHQIKLEMWNDHLENCSNECIEQTGEINDY